MTRRGLLQVLGAAIAAPLLPTPVPTIGWTYRWTRERIEVPVFGGHRIYVPGRLVCTRSLVWADA
jgi:hypothetical protein